MEFEQRTAISGIGNRFSLQQIIWKDQPNPSCGTSKMVRLVHGLWNHQRDPTTAEKISVGKPLNFERVSSNDQTDV